MVTVVEVEAAQQISLIKAVSADTPEMRARKQQEMELVDVIFDVLGFPRTD